MLTATPLQNGSHDLYTLLNVLRPDLIIDENTFSMMAEPNPHVTRVSSLARAASDNWRSAALAEMDAVAKTHWGQAYVVENPLFRKCRDLLLREAELTRDERVQFITDIEELHSFNSLINRTRRRDIEDFCVREPNTIEIPFTKPQNDLHEALLEFERTALSALHGNMSVQFMMTTVKRQAASCIFGLAPYLKFMLERRLAQLETAEGESETSLSASTVAVLESLAGRVLDLAEKLPPDDPKFDAVLDVILKKQAKENRRVMIFSSFRHTLYYVGDKLRSAGIRVGQVDGDVKDEERRSLRRRFMMPKEDPKAIDVMLFTEVGSEGLDYQFCDTMINYDLPWNPMAIEQRIGRIDRRKQKSEKVWIVNVITPGTVDADIYGRCLNKIGVFTESIGECEEILGDVAGDIKSIVLDGGLTDEQRRMKLEQIADNKVRERKEELRLEEEQKSFFGIDITNFKDNQAIAEAKSPWLEPLCLQGLVTRYFNARIAPGMYIQGAGVRKTLRLSREAKDRLLDDLRVSKLPRNALYLSWENYLKGSEQTIPVTFDRSFAQEESSVMFLTPVHPLVKVAARDFEKTNQGGEPCIAFTLDKAEVPPGRYPFAVYAWNYTGFTSQFKMITVPLDNKLNARLPSIVQEAKEFMMEGDASDFWKDIDPVHTQLWRKEKDAWIAETQGQERYKLQSEQLSFSRKKEVLEQKIRLSADPRISRMHSGELERAKERFEAKMHRIKDTAQRADIIFRKIANGMIIVEN
jgi:hypothetical protein